MSANRFIWPPAAYCSQDAPNCDTYAVAIQLTVAEYFTLLDTIAQGNGSSILPARSFTVTYNYQNFDEVGDPCVQATYSYPDDVCPSPYPCSPSGYTPYGCWGVSYYGYAYNDPLGCLTDDPMPYCSYAQSFAQYGELLDLDSPYIDTDSWLTATTVWVPYSFSFGATTAPYEGCCSFGFYEGSLTNTCNCSNLIAIDMATDPCYSATLYSSSTTAVPGLPGASNGVLAYYTDQCDLDCSSDPCSPETECYCINMNFTL